MPNSYLTFIQANDALAKCMAGQKAASLQALSAAEQENVCRAEASAVRELLANDSVSFRSLLAERMAAVKAQQQ